MATSPARRGRPPRYDRGSLLAVAAAQLLERGYSGLRYLDVAAAAEVPVASLRHYFPSITELRMEALKYLVLSEIEDLERTARAIADPWERLVHVCGSSVSPDIAGRREDWLLWLEYWRAAAYDEALGQERRAITDRFIAVMEQCIVDGIDNGQFTIDDTPREIAYEVLALIDGFGMRLAIDHTIEEALLATQRTERSVRRLLGVKE